MSHAPFTPTHHALLFGWIAREVILAVGEEVGAPLLRQAVQHYGEQRGRRMALRAQANGDPLTFASYLVYGEWRGPAGEMVVEVVGATPDLPQRVHRCSWHAAWESRGLMLYGRYYCQAVDEAIARGFNPDLTLEVNGTRSNGAPCCEFIYRGANLDEATQRWVDARRAALGLSVVAPWEYHAGHLFKSMGEAVIAALSERGRAIMQAALDEFACAYGQSAAQVVSGYASTDFNCLP